MFAGVMTVFVGCGDDHPVVQGSYTRSTYQDPILALYANKVKEEALNHKRIINPRILTLNFTNTLMMDGDLTTIGLCYYNNEGNGFAVYMYAPFWDKASETTKMNLMRHELGHCLMNKPHIFDRVAIMSPVLLNDNETTTAMIEELYR
jgi:hypothetical protein